MKYSPVEERVNINYFYTLNVEKGLCFLRKTMKFFQNTQKDLQKVSTNAYLYI